MKKKKKKMLTKKQKVILIVLAAFLLILIISIALTPIAQKSNTENTEIAISSDLTTIQEVVEYLESVYISTEESTADGYDIDIYVNFKYDLYEGDDSKKLYFTNFYEKIAMVTSFQSFRIIDSTRGITIAVKCENSKITEVLINGEENYFKNEESRRSQSDELVVEILDLEVNSSILQNLLDVKWVTKNATLGTQESSFNKYAVYFDEGYEIRTIQGKVYNIVFTEKYRDEVVAGYKVGDNLEEIQEKLGTSYEDDGIIGYKTKNFYIYFEEDEISIYPNYQYDDYEEFEELLENYNENKDINDFMDRLTDIWPDYDSYSYDTEYCDILYTLKGVKISFNSTNYDGIQIYENYKGDLKTEQTDLLDVYYRLDQNLIIQAEELRKMQTEFYDDGEKEDDPIHYSDKFYLQISYGSAPQIISIDGNYPNNELDDTISIYTYVWADDIHLIYSIQGNGIYIYNAETRETETLVTGNQQYDITNYDRNTNIIEYDDEKAQIDF